MGNGVTVSAPSPWASQYAASLNAYHDWSQDAAVAQYNQRVQQSDSQRDSEIELADAERDSANSAATSNQNRTMQATGAAFSAASAQAAALTAWGSVSTPGMSGNYQATFPTLSTFGNLTGYAIAAAPSSDYSVDTSTTYGWAYGWWGWGPDGYGYGGLVALRSWAVFWVALLLSNVEASKDWDGRLRSPG